MVIIINAHNIINEDEANKHWGKVPDAEDLELNEEESKIYEEKVKNEFFYTELEDEIAMLKACICDSEYHKIIDDRDAIIEILIEKLDKKYDELDKLSDYELIELLRTDTDIEITFDYKHNTVFFDKQFDLCNDELSILDKLIDSLNLRDFISEPDSLRYYEIKCEFPNRILNAKWTREDFDSKYEYKIEFIQK